MTAKQKQVQKSRVLDMTKGSPMRLLLLFSIPLFVGNLLQQFYNLADTSIAGHVLGDAALAQIGPTSALYSLITNFAFGLNNGLALNVSRQFGAGDEGKMRRSVCWMVTLSLASALVMTAISLVSRDLMADFLQIPIETRDGALDYLTVILAGIPFTMVYNMESALLQAVGNSVTPLLLLFFSSVLNIGLDFLFMGPLELGVKGAASATVLAQAISAVLGFVYIAREYPQLRFGKKEWETEHSFVFEMLKNGLSMALMSAIYNIGSVVLQSSINALGSVYIAAQTGGRRLAELFYVPGLALGTSAATYSSQNFGAGKGKRIKMGMRTAMFLYGIWWIIAVIFVFTAAPAAVKLLTGSTEKEVIRCAVQYLRISIPMIPPMAFLVIVRNVLQGMGYAFWPLFCSALELIGKIIFALWIVPLVGYWAVCVCEPVTWVICAIVIAFGMQAYRSQFKDKEEI